MSSLYVVEGGALKLGYKVRGKQRVLHLGKGFPLREAREIQRLVDALAVDPDVLPPEMTELLRDVPYRIRESMRRQGLLDFGFSSASTLSEAQQSVERAGLCPGGSDHFAYGWISLREFCGDDFPVSLLDGERVEAFAVFMSEKYAPKTVYDRFGSLRASFRYLQSRGVVLQNPFADVRAGSKSSVSSEYVPASIVEKVLPFCCDDETRLALIFARFAGVRTPSEIRDLRWSDIETECFHIRKGKTGARVVPLFPRVAEGLVKYRSDNSEWVFPKQHFAKSSRANNRIREAVEKSGVPTWAILMNSLRASCITEYAHMGFHEVTLNSVFGNSEAVRKKHYVKVRDQEYREMIRAGQKIGSCVLDKSQLSVLSDVFPLLSKEDVLTLWQEAQK